MRRVEVEIQELVLHGFARVDGAAIAESVERALGTRLADGGAELGGSRSVEHVDAPPIGIGTWASARTIGSAIAERLHWTMRP